MVDKDNTSETLGLFFRIDAAVNPREFYYMIPVYTEDHMKRLITNCSITNC
jgi:hypothetical protein